MILRRYPFLIALMLGLSACGFQLTKREPLPIPLRVMTVQSTTPYSPLNRQMREGLRRAGVEVVTNATVPRLVLHAEHFSQEIAATGATNQLTTYLLRYTVTYTLFNAQGQAIIGPKQIDTTRSFSINTNQMLGADNELALLRRDMRRDIITHILDALVADEALRRLSASKPHSDTTPPS